jgi:hypothetical protein
MSKKIKTEISSAISKGRTKQDKTEEAVQLRLRAIETTDGDINDLDYWLFQGGYTELDKVTMGKESWDKLKNNFSAIYNNHKKTTYEPPEDQKPIWERKVSRSFIRFIEVPSNVTKFYEIIIAYVKDLPEDVISNLSGVNLQQINVTSFFNQILQQKRKTASNATIMNAFVDLFKYHGMEKVGIDLNNLICSVMRNKNDNFEFQDAHQDYFPVAISTEEEDENPTINEDKWLAWSAIFPMSPAGSWLTIWFDQSSHYSFRLKYGQAVFFRSDVIHCGGRPKVDNQKGETFYRLHFYLQTKLQKAPNDKINKFVSDGRTLFSDLYPMTPEKLKQLEAEALERLKKTSSTKAKTK